MSKSKVCFVSGAARGKGNGRAIALSLAEKGYDVAVGDILYEEAKSVSNEIVSKGCKSCAVKIDLSIFESVKEGFDTITQELGSVDILINNAAIMTNMNTISKMAPQAWDNEIKVNLSGAFYCVKQVLPSMIENKWGRIVNISSVAGTMGGYGQCSYSSSKAGLIGLTKTIALEGAAFGVTSNVITLGVFGTNAFDDLHEKAKEKILRRVALKKEGSPKDVAALVNFLSSEDAKYITGANIMLTGGLDLFVF